MKTPKNVIKLLSLPLFGVILLMFIASSDGTFFRHFYPSSIKSIEPDIALELISNPDVLILDVREQEEYEVSHIANAFRYDKRLLNVIPKDQPILLYCTVGYRSAMKADELLDKGFKNVVNLDGGIIHWKNVNQKVQTISGQETDHVHVFNNFYGLWLKKGTASL